MALCLEGLRRRALAQGGGAAGRPAAEPGGEAARHLAQEAVFDYFAAQLFAAASDAEQQMLLRLSALPRMTPSMACAIAGDERAGVLLERMTRRHLFTDRRFDAEPCWQFHALFRGFLQARSRQVLGPQAHRLLLQQAGELLAAAGQHDDAFACLAQAGCWDAAAQLLLARAPVLVDTGRHATLAQWLAALPAARRDGDAWLLYWQGIAGAGHDAAAARRALERALALFDAAADADGQALALIGLLAGWWNELGGLQWMDPCAERLAALVDGAPRLDPLTRARGLVSLLLAPVVSQRRQSSRW